MKRFRLGALALLTAGLAIPLAAPAGASGGTFFPYSQPGTPASPSYTGISCVIDFSSVPDYSTVTSVTSATCGVTVVFSVPMIKFSVPDTWLVWGSGPNVESSTPAVLYSWTGVDSVTMTYYKAGRPLSPAGRRTVGVEVMQNWSAFSGSASTEDFTATFTGAGGGTDGVVSRTVSSELQPITDPSHSALLFGARTKTIPKVASLTITGSNNSDIGVYSGADNSFAVAQIRV
jgi:hypothetical protein